MLTLLNTISLRPVLQAMAYGLVSGAGMSLMLGTVFFSLIQNSIQNGWRKGALIALGVVVSDLIFIILAIIGVSYLTPEKGSAWIKVAAAVLLLFMGINMLLNKKAKVAYPETRLGKFLYFFSNGFLLNILNPVNFLFWAGLATIARTDWGYTTPELIMYFAFCLIGIFSMEVLVAYAAHRIKTYLNEKILLWINRGTGIMFIGLALKLVYDSFSG